MHNQCIIETYKHFEKGGFVFSNKFLYGCTWMGKKDNAKYSIWPSGWIGEITQTASCSPEGIFKNC